MSLASYMPNESYGRKLLIDAGREKGESNARIDYPHAAARDQSTLSQLAQYAFQEWYNKQTQFDNRDGAARQKTEDWNRYRTQGIQLFTSGFIAAYQETIAAKDEAARPKVQPQPQLTPTGATVTVKRVDHSRPNEYVYYLELVDPGYIEGSYEPEPLTLYFEGATIPETTSSAGSTTASSSLPSEPRYHFSAGYKTYDNSTQSQSKTSDKPRKPRGSYWGKP